MSDFTQQSFIFKRISSSIFLLCFFVLMPWQAFSTTLIPLNSGMQMTCQFQNNIAAQYSNSQIYVMIIGLNASNQFCYLDANGDMTPCVSGQNGSSYFLPLSAFNGFQLPSYVSSARLYVALGAPLNIPINTAANGSVGIAYPNIGNPSDPNINSVFDWIEFAVVNNAIWCNTTQVDMFGISMVMQLYTGTSSTYTLNGSAGINESSSAIFSEWPASVPAAFAGLLGPTRIVAPIHGSFQDGQANAGYFDSYIASVWAEYSSSPLVISIPPNIYSGEVGSDGRLAFTTPGDPNTYYVSEPTTMDVWGGSGNLATGNSTELALEAQICAGFHRHVIDNAANLNNPSAYYKTAPADYYAQFWHEHNLNGMAYGFCYDDVNNQSSTLSSANPRGLVIIIGPQPSPTSTLTPTPSYTPSFTPTTVPPVCASWVTNGNAFASGKGVTLTTAVNGEAGSAWNSSCINLSQNFNRTFQTYFGAAGGADGMDFVLQNDPRTVTALGGGGGNKGYAGAGDISPSVAFDLETYNSNGTLQMLENGSPSNTCGYAGSTCPYVFPNNVANQSEHSYQVVWNASAKTLTLIFDGVVVMSYNRDLINAVFGGNTCVYYGFTGATGGSNNLQYVYEVGCIPPTATITATPTSTNTLSETLTRSPTLTSTGTSTRSSSPTLSNSPTSTVTPSATESVTASSTKTNTATQLPTSTDTLTQTATWSQSPTVTATDSTTPSPSATSTETLSATPSVTSSATCTVSPSVTVTLSLTSTLSVTKSETVLASPTMSPSPRLSHTPTASPTPTLSPLSSPKPTFSRKDANSSGGQVQHVVSVPNPQHGPIFGFDLLLSGPVTQIHAMLYDRAMILVAQTEFPGTWESGWSRVNWQLPTLSNGVYFAVFSTGETQQDKPGILVVLH